MQDAISAGELSNFMEAMGISTDDVWTGRLKVNLHLSHLSEREEPLHVVRR